MILHYIETKYAYIEMGCSVVYLFALKQKVDMHSKNKNKGQTLCSRLIARNQ